MAKLVARNSPILNMVFAPSVFRNGCSLYGVHLKNKQECWRHIGAIPSPFGRGLGEGVQSVLLPSKMPAFIKQQTDHRKAWAFERLDPVFLEMKTPHCAKSTDRISGSVCPQSPESSRPDYAGIEPLFHTEPIWMKTFSQRKSTKPLALSQQQPQ